MAKFLLVAADAARARIFTRDKKYSVLKEIDTLVHPESRMMRQDLVSDRQGQVHESRSPGESSHQEPTDPKQKEFDRFAHELAVYLKAARNGNGVAGITLVAEPGFLGQLRKVLDEETRKLVIREVAKSVTTQTPEFIAATADKE
jgi:protein required for attachment to host cells